ncbi:MAG: uridine kinase [Vulcanibacillus sp.]
MHKPIVIGVTGGTGSGKTTVTKRILKDIPDQQILVIEQDSYYKDQSSIPFEERVKTNYDHPFAFDNDLFIEQLNDLLNYKTIDKPVYDYKVHTRKLNSVKVYPADVIIVEGILILEDKRLRDLMDIKIFVDTDPDVRFIRRLVRDIRRRERTMESVISQYLSVVRPMHLRFVEPTKRYADIIVPEGGENEVAIDLLVTKINTIFEKRQIS